MREGDQIPPEWVSSGARLEALSRFHEGLAHDLNNRLTTVLGYLSVLDEILPGEPQMLADLHHAAQEAAELVRLVQTFHKRYSLPMGPVEPARILVRLQDLLGRLCHSSRQIPVLLPDESLYIRGEEGALELLLVRILGECLDRPPALIRLREENGGVLICFQGLSLPRLPPAAAGLAECMQGQWTQTEDGYALRFPKQEIEIPEEPRPPPPPPGQSVLLAEGDASLRDFLAKSLAQAGFRVQTAADVTVCAARLSAQTFDCAVLDTRLPGGGYGALAALNTPPLRILWMEPYAGADRLPPEQALPKPFRPKDLIHRLS